MKIICDSFEIMACFLQFLYLFLFVGCFLESNNKLKIVFILILSCISIVFTQPSLSVLANAIRSLIIVITSVVFINVSYNGKLYRKIILILLFNMADIVIATLTSTILSYFVSPNLPLTNAQSSTVRIYYLVITFFVEFVIIYCIKNSNQRGFSIFSTSNLYISLIFFSCDFMVILGTFFLYAHIIPYNNVLAIVCCSICIFMLLCTGFVLVLLHHLEEKNRELLSQEILQIQIEEQKKFIQNQHHQAQLTNYLRHDLKHILLNYQLLLKDRNIEDVQTDISNRIGEFSNFHNSLYSGNPILDSLLQAKIDGCEDYNIKFDISAKLPTEYNNLDLFVIISNLIDNAIEAEIQIEQDYRKIIINLYTNESQLNFIIRNRVNESVLTNNPNFVTTKSHPENHGIGLQSVRYYIEKNNGLIDFFEKDSFFGVHIIMNI